MIGEAVHAAEQDGNPVSRVAADLAYGVAASLAVPASLAPAVSDNELGGIVFYWKGITREIQIEVDADSSHFVRVRGENGNITFIDEGYGSVPVEEVNLALRAWAAERNFGVASIPWRA